jgi:hypothetical protein
MYGGKLLNAVLPVSVVPFSKRVWFAFVLLLPVATEFPKLPGAAAKPVPCDNEY